MASGQHETSVSSHAHGEDQQVSAKGDGPWRQQTKRAVQGLDGFDAQEAALVPPGGPDGDGPPVGAATSGLLFDEPKSGGRFATRPDAHYPCVVPPKAEPELAGEVIKPGASRYPEVQEAHLAVVSGVERKRVELLGLIAQGPERPEIAVAIYELLRSEQSALCGELVALLDARGAMTAVLRACPADLLWAEDNLGETYRILCFRPDDVNLADVDLITRRSGGKVRRKLGEGDAVLVSELLGVVSKDGAKGREQTLKQSDDRKDQKADKRIGKAIKRSTRDSDETLTQPLGTRFIGAEQDETGTSNRAKLLASLAEPSLWAAGEEAQLDNTLRMVLAAGHRQHALDVAEAHAATEGHLAVLHAVGLVNADGVFLDAPEADVDPTRGAVSEAFDFRRQTKRGGGQLKVNIFTKRADVRGARLDELQDVTGGSLGGVTFERQGAEDADAGKNQLDLKADVRQGTVSMRAAHLAIAGIDTPVVKAGAATVLGFRLDATLPTRDNPDQPLRATIAFDKVEISSLLLQLREQMIAIGHLEVGATSIVSSVLRELTEAEQSALAAALGADPDGTASRAPITEAIGPSLSKMFAALGDIFADPSTVISNQMDIEGVTARDVTTSGGVHQEEASLSGLRTGIDVSGADGDKTIDLGVGLASVAGPLAVDTPKVRVSGPEIRVSDLDVKVTLDLTKNEHGRMAPRRIQLHSVQIGALAGDDTVLAVPGGLEARFPTVALRDLSAGGIQLPGRGYELSAEEAFGSAHASLGTLEIATQLQKTLGDDLRAGGTLSLTGLAVSSLDAEGVAFSLDDLHVADGLLEGQLPGPLAALRALGVDLRRAGVGGLSGEVRQTEDGHRASVTLGGADASATVATEDGTADASVNATGAQVELEVAGGTTRLQVGLESLATSARLDSPDLALDGNLSLHGVHAEVALEGGAATIVSLGVARIDGAPTEALLKRKGLALDFPTVAIEDVYARGIKLPGKGEKLDLGSVLADAEAGVGGVTVTGGVKDAVGEQLAASGTLRLDALAVRGLASGGVAFSLDELAVVDANASGGLLAKLGANNVGVRWLGVSDVAGEVHLGPDGPKGSVSVGAMGGDGIDVDGKKQSAMIHDTELGFDLSGGEQAVTLSLGAIATRADLAAPSLGIRGHLQVSDVSADVALRSDGEHKSATVRSLRVGAIRGDGTRVDVKDKGLRLDFPTVRVTGIEARGVELPGKGDKLDITSLFAAGGGVSLGRAELVGGVRSTLDDSLAAGGRFVLDDLAVDGLDTGGVAFKLGELSVNDLDVSTSKAAKLGRVGVKVSRLGVDDLSGTVTRGDDGLNVEGEVGYVGVDGAEVTTGGSTVKANANASGSFAVDDDNIAIEGEANATMSVDTKGNLPGLPGTEIGGHDAKPAKNPRFRWSLPVLDTLGGRVGLVIPVGAQRLPLVGQVTAGALDTAAMVDGLAVRAIDYVKARLPDVPDWLQLELLTRAGAAIEEAVRSGARSIGDDLAAQIPRIRPSVEDLLNSPKGPKGAKEPLDLSRYIGGMEGVDLQQQVKGALDVVAADAIGWMGSASTTVDFAKDDFATGAYNSAKSVWYRWVAPVAQQVTPDSWQDDLRVSQERVNAHTEWKEVQDKERAKYLSAAMFVLIEGAADWAGDIGLDLGLDARGPMVADELNSGQRAIDFEAALGLSGAGTVQSGVDLRLNLASHGEARFGNLDAKGWFRVETSAGGEVDAWQGTGQGDLDVAAGGKVNIRR